jgi:hypothetical protein
MVEEEPARRAYALYREGRVLEAARALKKATAAVYEVDEALWDRLYEAMTDTTWRARGAPFSKEQVVWESPGEVVLFLRGEPHEEVKMPVAVFPDRGWDYYTLVLDEELLAMEPLEELPG